MDDLCYITLIFKGSLQSLGYIYLYPQDKKLRIEHPDCGMKLSAPLLSPSLKLRLDRDKNLCVVSLDAPNGWEVVLEESNYEVLLTAISQAREIHRRPIDPVGVGMPSSANGIIIGNSDVDC
ncbi:hypothetical protein [Aeromonas salmonicida]|uniref:hypothetical protein n=1 Tax=Aeromonas salmonicida TaxID=645 RepID=UPI0038D3DCA6